MEAITWNSKPVYDSWGSTPDLWKGEQWLEWSNALRGHYDKLQADLIWSKAWLDGVSVLGGGTGNAEGADYVNDSVPIDDRTFNKTFRNFLNAQGNEILYNAVFSGIGGEVGSILSGSVQVTDDVLSAIKNAGSSVRNVGDTAANLTKVLSWLLPILLIILAAGAVYYVGKKTKTI